MFKTQNRTSTPSDQRLTTTSPYASASQPTTRLLATPAGFEPATRVAPCRYKGAALILPALPKADELLGDKGYDADRFRQALAKRGITACIPSKSNRKKPIEHDHMLYRQRHKIENMFGRLKDWRRVHILYDRCAHTFMSAIYGLTT